VLTFLQENVPQEAAKVEEFLDKFTDFQRMVQLELEIQSRILDGDPLQLRPADARYARQSWDTQETLLQLVVTPKMQASY
jgi:hypothetical protein